MTAVDRVTDALSALNPDEIETLAQAIVFCADMHRNFAQMSVDEALHAGATAGATYPQRAQLIDALAMFADALNLPSH